MISAMRSSSLLVFPARSMSIVGHGDGRPPRGQQECTFEDKSIREKRLRQSVQESFHGEVLAEFMKRTVLRARFVEQSLPNRRAYIATAHRTASRYGRMTFWTRLI